MTRLALLISQFFLVCQTLTWNSLDISPYSVRDAAQFTTADGQTLVVLGGMNSTSSTSDIWTLNLTALPTQVWTKVGALAGPWSKAFSLKSTPRAVLNTDTGLGWVFGVSNGQDLQQIDSNLTSISFLNSTALESRYAFGMAYLRNHIFVYSGLKPVGSLGATMSNNDLWEYDLATGNWTLWSVIGNPVHYSLELTTYNGSIYETFGALNNTYLSSLYIWNLNFANHTMTKVPVADIGSGRAAHGIVMIGSIMISLGGVTASGAFETWWIDLSNSTDIWHQFTNSSGPAYSCATWPIASYNAAQKNIFLHCKNGASWVMNVTNELGTWGASAVQPMFHSLANQSSNTSSSTSSTMNGFNVVNPTVNASSSRTTVIAASAGATGLVLALAVMLYLIRRRRRGNRDAKVLEDMVALYVKPNMSNKYLFSMATILSSASNVAATQAVQVDLENISFRASAPDLSSKQN